MSSFLDSTFAGRNKIGKAGRDESAKKGKTGYWHNMLDQIQKGKATPQKPSRAGAHLARYLTPTPQKPSKLGTSLSNVLTMRKSSAGSYTAPTSSGTIKTSKRSATG